LISVQVATANLELFGLIQTNVKGFSVQAGQPIASLSKSNVKLTLQEPIVQVIGVPEASLTVIAQASP